MKIYLDMDGVLTNFMGMLNRHYPHIQKDHHRQEEFWKAVDSIPNFWTEMPWMDDGKELVEFCRPHGFEIMTAPSRSPKCQPGKLQWVAEHIGSDVKVNFVPTKQKQHLAAPNHILIDDTADTIEGWRKRGGIGIYHHNAAQSISELQHALKYPTVVRALGG